MADEDADGVVVEAAAEAAAAPPEVFPREYVEELRAEAKSRREAAAALEAEADGLRRRLVAALIAQDGRLADPEDLPYDPSYLDPDRLSEATTALLEAKPHYAARRSSPLPEQSVSADEPVGPTFAELLRNL